MTQAEFQFIEEAIKRYANDLVAKVYNNAIQVALEEKKAEEQRKAKEEKKAKEGK